MKRRLIAFAVMGALAVGLLAVTVGASWAGSRDHCNNSVSR
jgi:hypothetical protein